VALVIYKGDHAGVVVPVTATMSVEATWGEPVDVPDTIAERLLGSAAWMKADAKATKKAVAADATEDNTDKGKG